MPQKMFLNFLVRLLSCIHVLTESLAATPHHTLTHATYLFENNSTMRFDAQVMHDMLKSLQRNFHSTSAVLYVSKHNDFIFVNSSSTLATQGKNTTFKPLQDTSKFAWYNSNFSTADWFNDLKASPSQAWKHNVTIDNSPYLLLCSPLFVIFGLPSNGFWGSICIAFSYHAIYRKLSQSTAILPSATAFIISQKYSLVAVANIDIYGQLPFTNAVVSAITLEFKQNTEGSKKAQNSTTEISTTDGDYLYQIKRITDPVNIGWFLVIAVKQSNFIRAVTSNTIDIILGSFTIMFLALAVVVTITALISYVICTVSKQMHRIANMSIEPASKFISVVPFYEIQMMQHALEVMKNGLDSFQKYVPVSLVQRIMQHNKRALLGMEAIDCTIMFMFVYFVAIIHFVAILKILRQYLKHWTHVSLLQCLAPFFMIKRQLLNTMMEL